MHRFVILEGIEYFKEKGKDLYVARISFNGTVIISNDVWCRDKNQNSPAAFFPTNSQPVQFWSEVYFNKF